jgi:hypothetical protein
MKRLITLSLVAFVLYKTSGIAAPKSELWPRWQTHNAENREVIDHSAWGIILKKYLVTSQLTMESSAPVGINLLQYGGVSKIDYDLLKIYLTTLEGIPISSFSRPEQRAFWINLYNAATVNLILEHYPVESITKISFSFFSFGPWDEELLTIEGEELSLNDIEHRILRPIWQDPRIHYALNCASIGCPNLQPIAFTAKNTDSLLETGASEYINHPRGAKKEDKKLWLSKIFEWYQDDYGGNEAGVLIHIQKYAKENLANSLYEDELEIEYHYDWRLNESGP